MALESLARMLLAGLVLAAAADAAAAVISYDEAVDGDLSNSFDGTQITDLGTLDIGTNTISGSTVGVDVNSVTTDFDNFGFFVPVGAHLTRIIYSFDFVWDSDALPQIVYTLSDSYFTSGFLSSDVVNTSMSSPKAMFTFLVPGVLPGYPAGDWAIFSTNVGSLTACFPSCDWRVDYTWSLVVEPLTREVPEPETLVLLALGLLMTLAQAIREPRMNRSLRPKR